MINLDVSGLPAGRKLDALIRRLVFGDSVRKCGVIDWPIKGCQRVEVCHLCYFHNPEDPCVRTPQDFNHRLDYCYSDSTEPKVVEAFSTDDDLTAQVIKRARGLLIGASGYDKLFVSSDGASCHVSLGCYEASGETLALAACRAALLVALGRGPDIARSYEVGRDD